MDEVSGGQSSAATSQGPSKDERRETEKLRLLLVLPFVITALILLPLAMVKKATEVEVSLKVSRVSFVLDESSTPTLFNAIQVKTLRLQNMREVPLGPGKLEMATASDPKSGLPVAWKPIGEGLNMGILFKADTSVTFHDVTLDRLDVKPGSVVTLSWTAEEPNRLNLLIGKGEVTGSLSAKETLGLSCDYCEVTGLPERYKFESKILRLKSQRAHTITFSAPFSEKDGLTSLDLDFPPGTKPSEGNLAIQKGLDFTEPERREPSSSVIGEGGKIILEEINQKEIPIKPGNFLILDGLQRCFIKKVSIDNGINLILHGRVGKMKTGPAHYLKDLRPSLLEWIHARQTWFLYLNALIVVGSMALSILKRLRVIREKE